MLGTNDSKDVNWNAVNFKRDLAALVQSYLALVSSPKVYLLIPFQIQNTKAIRDWGMQPKVIKYEIPKIIREIGSDLKVRVVDLSMLYIDPKQPDRVYKKGEPGFWTRDGVHPNDEGYKKFARAVYQKTAPWK